MKSTIKSLLLAAVAGLGALSAQAQSPAPKIVQFNLAKLFEQYYQTQDLNDKLNQQKTQAEDQAKAMIADRDAMIARFNVLVESVNSTTITDEKKKLAEQEGQQLRQKINDKQNELQQFTNNIRTVLQQQFNTFKDAAVNTISDVATKMAKAKGGNMLIDNSKSTTYGTSPFIFIDESFTDITAEVLAKLNAGRPARVATPAAAVAPTVPDVPSVTFPGAATPAPKK